MDLKNRLSLYVIPDEKLGGGRNLIEQTEAALAGGATAIQLRMKDKDGRAVIEAARHMRTLCEKGGALFFMNDRVDIALAVRADGVHVGQSDMPAEDVRRIVPRDFLVGVSASTPEAVRAAERAGADYLGVGAVHATGTKTDATEIGLGGLRAVRSASTLPVVAIGGVNLERAPAIFDAGADGLAIISAIVSQPDIAEATRAFAALLRERRGA